MLTQSSIQFHCIFFGFHSTTYKIPCLLFAGAGLFQLGNLGLDGRWVGTLDLGDHASVLEELEGWHATDTAFGGNIGGFINIDLDEDGIGEFGGPLFEHGSDHAAGRAPGGSEVNDKKLIASLEGVEFCNVCEELDHGCGL